ncbi:MAG: hypothetical protein H6560_19625 [Lewinellaceae bacterium]|nr:hypothetical protein [Lewinellaceae bacterium]
MVNPGIFVPGEKTHYLPKNEKPFYEKLILFPEAMDLVQPGMWQGYARRALRACLEATLWAKKCPFFADMALLFSSVPPGMHFKKRLVSSKN